MRRKTLVNCLKSSQDLNLSRTEAEKLLADTGLEQNIRGEALSLEERAALRQGPSVKNPAKSLRKVDGFRHSRYNLYRKEMHRPAVPAAKGGQRHVYTEYTGKVPAAADRLLCAGGGHAVWRRGAVPQLRQRA